MKLTEETRKELTEQLDRRMAAGVETWFWITGRPIGELPFRRLLQYCLDSHSSGKGCRACPLEELCEGMDLQEAAEAMERTGWKGADWTLPDLIRWTQLTMNTATPDSEGPWANCGGCPLGKDWPCISHCPGRWLRTDADYWRHTEDELL